MRKDSKDAKVGKRKAGLIRLSDAEIGKTYIVVKIEGRGFIKKRLLDMGILPGLAVRVIRVAPLRDPIEISARGIPVSVRKSEARYVVVKEVNNI